MIVVSGVVQHRRLVVQMTVGDEQHVATSALWWGEQEVGVQGAEHLCVSHVCHRKLKQK
jgi:hypothetical protein